MTEFTIPVTWTGEQYARRYVLSTALVVADGGRFRVTRVSEAGGHGVPVVLVPGMFDNRRLYLWPGGGGLADTLADAGFEVWIVERRGTGGVALSTGARAGWEEVVCVDLPAVQRLIATQTDVPAFWVGHSFGGVALARAAAETMQRSQIAGLVLVNSAVDIPLLANRIVAATLGARLWRGVFPARRFGLGPEDEPVAALADAISWGAAERTGAGLSAVLGAVDVPVLVFTAPRDAIAPATRCARLARPFAGADARVQSAARRTGFARNHSHESPLLHPAATTDVFPFLRDWLVARTTAATHGSGTVELARRYRVQSTVELEAPAEAVFGVLSRRWSTLWPVRQRRVRDGVDPTEPDGLRSVRAQKVLGLWPIQEEIVCYRPPRLIEYRTIRGPVRNHLGHIQLTDLAGGRTRLDYRIAFDTPWWAPGQLLAAAIGTTWRRWSLPRLRRHLARQR
ncbi:alpha/beta fold hydrolase [Mycobacterium angelicum]|uniref:Serine aminopeptidase S33 domain-containing protein n=1 Tax=Mycobacterium angelicum TaxID=470074 RepID=A0A1W9ZR77_MYCAN|nr:alpha/beta fold hydrolase [Mycobacterium angelicum]MCV7196728.1 alpha/beta hydrolase [Mycobacterium angelicum]ORA20290.1 hypothetical protein BST12_15485 [Mycobacterium angelicum]